MLKINVILITFKKKSCTLLLSCQKLSDCKEKNATFLTISAKVNGSIYQAWGQVHVPVLGLVLKYNILSTLTCTWT